MNGWYYFIGLKCIQVVIYIHSTSEDKTTKEAHKSTILVPFSVDASAKNMAL